MPQKHRSDTEEDIVGSLRRDAQRLDDERGRAANSRDHQPSQTAPMRLRPWTIEAAMEPLPPLAPPVETPMTETRPANRTATSPQRFSTRVIAESVALVVLILIAILLLLARHSGR